MKEILKDAIKTHYEKEDYTEVVRDAIICLMGEIRKKSNLQDDDGVDLINKAFSEKKPLVMINKMQTQTEKNKHRGINDLCKGIVEYFRNPMSHGKQTYSKEVADALLVIIDNIILEEIIKSKSLNSIEDWYLEIVDELSPNTSRYAVNLVNSIPQNKVYEVLLQLYKNRENIKNEKMYIVSELVKKLKPEEFIEYCSAIEKDIFGKVSEEEFVNMLRFISVEVLVNFKDLTRIKIEDMVLEDINRMQIYIDEYNEEGLVQKSGEISSSSKHLIDQFSNKIEILDAIYEKMINSNDEYEFEFIINNFFDIVSKEVLPKYDIIGKINRRLSYSNNPIWFDTLRKKIQCLPKDNEWYKNLAGVFRIYDSADAELPF